MTSLQRNAQAAAIPLTPIVFYQPGGGLLVQRFGLVDALPQLDRPPAVRLGLGQAAQSKQPALAQALTDQLDQRCWQVGLVR